MHNVLKKRHDFRPIDSRECVHVPSKLNFSIDGYITHFVSFQAKLHLPDHFPIKCSSALQCNHGDSKIMNAIVIWHVKVLFSCINILHRIPGLVALACQDQLSEPVERVVLSYSICSLTLRCHFSSQRATNSLSPLMQRLDHCCLFLLSPRELQFDGPEMDRQAKREWAPAYRHPKGTF